MLKEVVSELEILTENLKKRQEKINSDPCWGFSEGSKLHKTNLNKEIATIKTLLTNIQKNLKR